MLDDLDERAEALVQFVLMRLDHFRQHQQHGGGCAECASRSCASSMSTSGSGKTRRPDSDETPDRERR